MFYLGMRPLSFAVSGLFFPIFPALIAIVEIEIEEDIVPWAAAGSNVTLYVSGIDRINIG